MRSRRYGAFWRTKDPRRKTSEGRGRGGPGGTPMGKVRGCSKRRRCQRVNWRFSQRWTQKHPGPLARVHRPCLVERYWRAMPEIDRRIVTGSVLIGAASQG